MLLTIRPEEEPEAVHGKAGIERFTLGRVVDPFPPLDRLIGRLVNENEPQMGQEKKPYPDIMVSLVESQNNCQSKQPSTSDGFNHT